MGLPRREPRVVDRVESRRGHAGGQPTQQRKWIHVDGDRPIPVGLLSSKGDANEAVGLLLHSLLRDRRA
jgi:hypothetical protein